MEKVIISSSIPLHIEPVTGCAGVMLISETMGTCEAPHKPEIKALQDVSSLDDEANEINP